MGYDWKRIKQAKEFIRYSQKEKFPYFINPDDVFGMKIQVNKHVFSPKYGMAYRYFMPKLPDFTGKRVLEIGCGSGVVACYLAKMAKYVLATDINRYAVNNTTINAKHNKLKNLEVRQSDVFSNIRRNEKFDAIIWNTPWAKLPRRFRRSIKPEDYGVFDVDYEATRRFILEGKKHLRPRSSIYIIFGTSGRDFSSLEDIVKESGLWKEIVLRFNLEEGADLKLRYNVRMYKLS